MSGQGSLYDTSVWIALAFSAHPLHAAAIAVFQAAPPAAPALFCRATQQSFLRLLSTPKITQHYGVTLTNHDALAMYDGFAASPKVGFIDEPANLWPRWRTLADLPTASPKRWMDAYLAAFAIQSGLPLVTGDNDFKAFVGLNPTVIVAPSSTAAPPPSSGGANAP